MNSARSSVITLALAILALHSATSHAVAQRAYRVQQFADDIPRGLLNDLGNAAGTINSEAKFWRAEPNELIDLGDLPPPQTGRDVAMAINNLNAICGSAQGPLRGFLWDQQAGIRMAGPDYPTHVFGLNDHGVVVGHSINPDAGQWVAFFWSDAGGTTYLPLVPSQVNSAAYCINNSGEIGGHCNLDDTGARTFFWSEAEGLRVLSPLPDGTRSTYIGEMNSLGQIAGVAASPTAQYSFIWSAHAPPEISPFEIVEETRSLLPDGGLVHINDRGEAIGSGAWTELEFEHYSYVAGSGRPLLRFTRRIDPCESFELRQSFPSRFRASDINNLGVIAGSLDSSSSNPTLVWLLPYIAGDPDFDGDTDLYDLAVTLTHFGESDPSLSFTQGDVDEDGDVDLEDLAHVLVNFGQRCPLP